jgi:long-chain acyl-CoA synthetase
MYPGTHAVSSPDRPAVIMAGSGGVVTYAELDDRSARLASALHSLGLRKGDVVALLSDNAAEAFEIYWGAMRSGLYITAVNWHLAPEEAAYILADSGAKVVIASAGVRDLAEQVAQLVPGVEHWFAFGGSVDGYRGYAALIATAVPRLTDQPRGSDMLYSSGTTGRPMIAWWGPILAEYSGATEGHGVTLITTPEWKSKRGSVGRAALGVLHICDDEGT